MIDHSLLFPLLATAITVVLLCWLIVHVYFGRILRAQRQQLERLRRENDR